MRARSLTTATNTEVPDADTDVLVLRCVLAGLYLLLDDFAVVPDVVHFDLLRVGGPVGMTVIAAAITVTMVWRWRSRTPLILVVIAVTGSLTMTTVGKALVGRPRPPLVDAVPPYEYAFSFPSGHALNSTVIAGVVAYLLITRLRRRWARVLTVVLAVAWALAIGASRVFLGHHWLTDVVFAWLLGAGWVALIVTAHRLFLTVRRHRADPG